MKIGKKFNTMTKNSYFFYIENHEKYKDFNPLGLYRSIMENDKLHLDDKIEVREYAHKWFKKTFDFLQLKDPITYIEVTYLGKELTKADQEMIWKNVRKNQQKILADKKIKHRNFGIYSKHNCGYADCKYNGMMIRQGSWLTESNMYFEEDKNEYLSRQKSEKRKFERKNQHQIIKNEHDLS